MINQGFFLNDRPPPEISALALHDPLRTPAVTADPIALPRVPAPTLGDVPRPVRSVVTAPSAYEGEGLDRKSTRLNSSHANISYAVFCLKKNNHYRTAARARTSMAVALHIG